MRSFNSFKKRTHMKRIFACVAFVYISLQAKPSEYSEYRELPTQHQDSYQAYATIDIYQTTESKNPTGTFIPQDSFQTQAPLIQALITKLNASYQNSPEPHGYQLTTSYRNPNNGLWGYFWGVNYDLTTNGMNELLQARLMQIGAYPGTPPYNNVPFPVIVNVFTDNLNGPSAEELAKMCKSASSPVRENK